MQNFHISRKTEETKPAAQTLTYQFPAAPHLAHFIRKYGDNYLTHYYNDKPEKITKLEYTLSTYFAWRIGWKMTIQLDEAKKQLTVTTHDMPWEWIETITIIDTPAEGANQTSLRNLGNGQILLTLNTGTTVLFCFDIPVAAHIPGRGYIRTATDNNEVLGYINQFVGDCDIVEQSEIDQLLQ